MGIGFSLLTDPEPTVYRNYVIASQAYTIGDCVDVSRTAADVVPSTSSSVTYGIRGVAMQTVASTATVLLVALATDQQLWTADTANTANTAHNYQRMALSTQRLVNNTGTDVSGATGVFEQWGILGGTNSTTTRIVGRFLVGVNNA